MKYLRYKELPRLVVIIQFCCSKQPAHPHHEDLDQPDLPEPGGLLSRWWLPQHKGTTTLATAGGEEINVTRGRYITVKSSTGEAGVIAFDVLATNGVVHLVNSVF